MKFIWIPMGLLLLLVGCSHVTSAAHTTETHNGDAWYVRTSGLPNLPFSVKVFYCPEPTSAVVTCTQATMLDEPVPPAGYYSGDGSGYGPPPMQGQPGYGPPPSGYGPPPMQGQPGYGPPPGAPQYPGEYVAPPPASFPSGQ